MNDKKTRVITYGTFDLFHVGHLKILERARDLGDELYVGVSTDSFNNLKGKKCEICFDHRIEIIKALRCVTFAFPENNWEQKSSDIEKFRISRFVMGDDWEGKFDFLKSCCDVVYLPRTPGISTTEIKGGLQKRRP